MPAVILRSSQLRAAVLPAIGGGLARLDWIDGDAPHPVFRSMADKVQPAPSQFACFPLVPWSNRIAPDGFMFEGRQHRPAPNRDGEPCPIHGEGWQRAWTIAAQSSSSVTLTLDCAGRPADAPFSFHATLKYELDGPTLRVGLSVRNAAAVPMPFGLGLHPWLVREPGVTVCAPADQVWLRGEDGLPTKAVPIPAAWDFSCSRSLPPSQIDHAFTGWNGLARIAWPSGWALDIAADMGYYILYAPKDRDLFCFEPVDHAINAHNLPGGAAHNGLTILAPGQSLERKVSFTITPP